MRIEKHDIPGDTIKYRMINADEVNYKCDTIKPNNMQCTRKVTRAITDGGVVIYMYVCEGHFQAIRQIAESNDDKVLDLDATRLDSEKNDFKSTEPN